MLTATSTALTIRGSALMRKVLPIERRHVAHQQSQSPQSECWVGLDEDLLPQPVEHGTSLLRAWAYAGVTALALVLVLLFSALLGLFTLVDGRRPIVPSSTGSVAPGV
jgi:hypothetical protein